MEAVAANQLYRYGQLSNSLDTGSSSIRETGTLQKSDCVGRAAIQNSTKEAQGTSKTCEFVYFGNDVIGLPRTVECLFNAVHGQKDPAGIHGLGLTTIFSVYTGYVAGQRGKVQYAQASQIGDRTGQLFGAVNMARAPMEIMGGVTFTSVRTLSIAATYTSAKSVTAAATALGAIGSAFYAGTYILLAAPSAACIAENIQFGRALDQAMDQVQTPAQKARVGLKALMQGLDGTLEEKKGFLKGIAEDPTIWEEEVPTDPGATDHRQYTQEERRFLWKEAGEYTTNDFSHARLYGHFKKHYGQFKAKKDAEFSRKTGPESVSLIRKELSKPSHERVLDNLDKRGGVEKAQGIIDTVKGEMKKNKILHAAIIFFCVVGASAFIAATISTGGALGVAIGIASLVTAVGMIAIDGYFLYKTLQSGNMDKKDKIQFFVANAVLIMISATGVFFSGGLVPIVIGGAMLVLWSAVALYSVYHWKFNKDQEERLEAPYRGSAHVSPTLKKKLA